MRRRPRPTTLPIGTISEGTLKPEDLIDALLPAIEGLRLSRTDRTTVRRLRAEYAQYADVDHDDSTREALSEAYDELAQLAESLVPAYCAFGAHEGDGACIGVWPYVPENGDDDVHRSADGPHTYRVSMTRTRADGYLPCDTCGGRASDHLVAASKPYWLHVNDHGNATLYARIGKTWGRYREVWSVV